MRHRLILAILVLLAGIATACRPRSVLSPSKMEDLLVDLHRTDGIISVSGYRYDKDSLQKVCYAEVLLAHHTTQAQFDSSLVWYTAHPRIFDKIYPRVIERLQQQQKSLEEQQSKEQDNTQLIPDQSFSSIPLKTQPQAVVIQQNEEKMGVDLHNRK